MKESGKAGCKSGTGVLSYQFDHQSIAWTAAGASRVSRWYPIVKRLLRGKEQ